jgi:hypothetical protein
MGNCIDGCLHTCEVSCDLCTDIVTCNFCNLLKCECADLNLAKLGDFLEDKLTIKWTLCNNWCLTHPKAKCVYDCFCGKYIPCCRTKEEDESRGKEQWNFRHVNLYVKSPKDSKHTQEGGKEKKRIGLDFNPHLARVKRKGRLPTDVPCLLLFIFFLFVMFGIAIYSFVTGDPQR